MLDVAQTEYPTIESVFASYGITVTVHSDGTVESFGTSAKRLSALMTAARRAHEAIASGDNDAIRAIAEAGTVVEVTLRDGESHQALIEASAVMGSIAAIDLAVRLETLCEASDPAEELRFLADACERRDIDQLGERVGAAAQLLGVNA